MFKVFIDGKEGTTGLRIYERFLNREDIEILTIPDELRKDPVEKAKIINQSDITFLCLPDAAAIESVSLVTNPNTRIIDASTAHRTNADWAYGFPELDNNFHEKIKNAKKVAVPGCYATGFTSIVYPLIKMDIITKDFPIIVNAISGYSGAGKKAIALYEDKMRKKELDAPRLYSMAQAHKHLKEMKYISNLDKNPIFNPYICDFYSGMLVTISLDVSILKTKITPKKLQNVLKNYYKENDFIRVQKFLENGTETGFLPANHLSGKDYLEIYVTGNEERINIIACLDNLGKGASGAAIECMNIMLGLDAKTGLEM